jgi:hypothetical protein
MHEKICAQDMFHGLKGCGRLPNDGALRVERNVSEYE